MFFKKHTKKAEMIVLNEVFRVLKSNIMFSESEKKIKTITITSCSPGEGKTTVALNLAVSMAESDVKVLIIDFEFRKKRNELLFENEKTINASTDRLIKDTVYKNLKYLSLVSKFPNPESFIDSAQLKNFIDDLSRSFDKVIIDAPPLEGVIDSALIAANTNVTLFVIESKRHDYRKVLQIKEQLEKAGARILGVVLCKADKSSLKSFFEYQKYCKKNKLNKALEIEQYIAV